MDVEKECSALGGLFQQIITDMKNGAPLWEDLISKATKLHTCLRAAILAASAYLEAFQKIADAATNARGATKEIGTALTRICLRHKAVETRVKSFTCAIMDCLVVPLQEKLEDWKKSLVNLDKEHAKEYKKAKAELKKRSVDTFRLQKKKARKVQQQQQQGHGPPGQANQAGRTSDEEFTRLLESSTAVVNEKRLSLEETERKAVRAALLEERGRYCLLARFLKPVLDEEIAMLMELTHLQEVSDQLERHAASPLDLPAASEQIISDLKVRDSGQWALATPPSSPSLSLGSRKSSMCSISSLTSSSSGSCKNNSNSCTHPWHRSLSQPLRAPPSSVKVTNLRNSTSGSSSRDSGFTSQDTLYKQAIFEHQVSNASNQSTQSAGCTNVSRPLTTSTWPDLQESVGAVEYDRKSPNTINERPHTISSAYEKGHQRAALSVYTFQAPDANNCCHSQPASPVSSPASSNPQLARVQMRKNSASAGVTKPPIPNRCSSLERPSSTTKTDSSAGGRGKPKLPIPAHLAKELGNHTLAQPMYVNMHELANLAANRAQEMQQMPHHQIQHGQNASAGSALSPSTGTAPDKAERTPEKDGSQTSESSLESSSGYGSQTTLPNSQSGQNPSDNNSPGGAWSTSAPPPTCILSRRGSMQQATRPPPPTRRTSTIISGNYSVPPLVSVNLASAGSNTACGAPAPVIPSTAGVDHENSTTFASRSIDETENLPPPPAFLLEGSSPNLSPTPQRSISVSDTIRTLTELRHTPASPSLMRKVMASQQQQQPAQQPPNAVRSSIVERTTISTRSIETTNTSTFQGSGPGGVGHSFMAVLSAKLIGSTSGSSSSGGSPKSARKNTANSPETSSKGSSRGATHFFETLNAKLSHQQHQQQQQQFSAQQQPQQQQEPQQAGGNHQASSGTKSVGRSASVRRIMGNRVPVIDPQQVRGSLMDQIRRGTSLRKTTGPINDRSAPRIH